MRCMYVFHVFFSVVLFFFNQKSAYEMRISDWSSDVCSSDLMQELFAREKFVRAIHLAAQAGVRYSLQNPLAYVDSNVVGFASVLEGCRHNAVEHLDRKSVE